MTRSIITAYGIVEIPDGFAFAGVIEGEMAKMRVFHCHTCHALTDSPKLHLQWHQDEGDEVVWGEPPPPQVEACPGCGAVLIEGRCPNGHGRGIE